MQLTFFETLLMTHFVMDWVFQTKWEALNKFKKWFPLMVHCFIYTAGFISVFLLHEVHFSWLIFIFCSHVVLDRRSPEIYLLEKFRGIKATDVPEPLWWVLLIGSDQVFHLIVLAVLVLLV